MWKRCKDASGFPTVSDSLPVLTLPSGYKLSLTYIAKTYFWNDLSLNNTDLIFPQNIYCWYSNEYLQHMISWRNNENIIWYSNEYLPALVAQLDAHPTGYQEIVGSTLPGSATFFRGDWSYFSPLVILSLPLIQEGQLSVSCKKKNGHNTA